jgi:hypothetical protein
MDAEQVRQKEARTNKADWKQWGPYLSERRLKSGFPVRAEKKETGAAPFDALCAVYDQMTVSQLGSITDLARGPRIGPKPNSS